MAVKLINTIRKYIGESGDTKPTFDVPIGSEFYEEDTRKTFEFNGTAWVEGGSRTIIYGKYDDGFLPIKVDSDGVMDTAVTVSNIELKTSELEKAVAGASGVRATQWDIQQAIVDAKNETADRLLALDAQLSGVQSNTFAMAQSKPILDGEVDSSGALAADEECTAVTLTALLDNIDVVKFGTDGSQSNELDPGASVYIPCTNLNQVHVTVTGTDKVTFLAVGVT